MLSMGLSAYLLLGVTIYGCDDQSFTPMKIFEAIKPAKHDSLMDGKFI
jgi:hypothetical protein